MGKDGGAAAVVVGAIGGVGEGGVMVPRPWHMVRCRSAGMGRGAMPSEKSGHPSPFARTTATRPSTCLPGRSITPGHQGQPRPVERPVLRCSDHEVQHLLGEHQHQHQGGRHDARWPRRAAVHGAARRGERAWVKGARIDGASSRVGPLAL